MRLNVLAYRYPLSLRFMCLRDISKAGCAAETFTIHSYQSIILI